MFLLEPDRTQFDLNFRTFGTHVRVHPMFWLLSALLGQGYWKEPYGLPYLIMWIVCVFLSILIHELGHVLMGRLFGSDGHIVLYSFGGLAIGSKNLTLRWQRVLVSFAGPMAQFILLGFVLLGWFFVPGEVMERYLYVRAAFFQMMVINLFWPVLNLLPIWPLDGGQISRELLDWLMPRNGIRVALGLSMVVAGFLAINSIKPLIPYIPLGGTWNAIFFGMLAISNYFEMQQLDPHRRRQEYDDSDHRGRDRDPWGGD